MHRSWHGVELGFWRGYALLFGVVLLATFTAELRGSPTLWELIDVPVVLTGYAAVLSRAVPLRWLQQPRRFWQVWPLLHMAWDVCYGIQLANGRTMFPAISWPLLVPMYLLLMPEYVAAARNGYAPQGDAG